MWNDEEHDRFGCEMMISVTKARKKQFLLVIETSIIPVDAAT